jgi:hypothetical protein
VRVNADEREHFWIKMMKMRHDKIKSLMISLRSESAVRRKFLDLLYVAKLCLSCKYWQQCRHLAGIFGQIFQKEGTTKIYTARTREILMGQSHEKVCEIMNLDSRIGLN